MKILFYVNVLALMYAAVYASVGEGKTYTMDLFTVFSFGLAIAAFALSIFMAWLSWEFYKKTTAASESVQASVYKVETSVVGIQSDIKEIVQTAVKHWTQGNAQNIDGELQQALDQIQILTAELEEMKRETPELQSKIEAVEKAMLSHYNRANDLLKQSKAQSIFPSIDLGPAILCSQTIYKDIVDFIEGEISIEVRKPIRNASYRVRTQSEIPTDPEIQLELVSSPDTATEVALKSGIGLNNKLNVHVAGGKHDLTPGTYVLHFMVKSKGD